MTKFALRTQDAQWVARNGGTADESGRTVVLVPDVERVTFAGRNWLRHTFADIPADYPTGAVMCLAEWVES